MKAKLTAAILVTLTILFMTGCSGSEDEPDGGSAGPVSEVDLTLELGGDWTIDLGESRAAPPGGDNSSSGQELDGWADVTGDYNVDKIRVITFKHRESDSDPAFYYDANNDMVLDVETTETAVGSDGKPSGHVHKIARGKIRKTYGFQYRVVAVAYSATRKNTLPSGAGFTDGEDSWFEIDCGDMTTFDNFTASLISKAVDNLDGFSNTWSETTLSEKAVNTPQLFYGICSTASSPDGIINYSETDTGGQINDKLPIKGILYRGMAKITLEITPRDHVIGLLHYPVKWIALMADNVPTSVSLGSYDDFLTPGDHISGYTPIAYATSDGKSTVTLNAWILPCTTHLAVRIRTASGPTNYTHTRQLTCGDDVSVGNGTGIISPNVKDNLFYLRRNHKYTLKVSDSEKLTEI